MFRVITEPNNGVTPARVTIRGGDHDELTALIAQLGIDTEAFAVSPYKERNGGQGWRINQRHDTSPDTTIATCRDILTRMHQLQIPVRPPSDNTERVLNGLEWIKTESKAPADFDDSFEGLRRRLLQLDRPRAPRGPRLINDIERANPSTAHRDFMVQCDLIARERGLIPGPGDDRSWPDRLYLRESDASIFGYFEFKTDLLDNPDQIKRMLWLMEKKQRVRAGRTIARFYEFLEGSGAL